MKRHALILAAGKGVRFGFPKSLISVHEKPLVQEHVNHLKNHLSVRVVLSEIEYPCELVDCTVLFNLEGTSMMSSIHTGINDLCDSDLILIVPVDTVPVTEPELERLIALSPPAVLAYHNQAGHPIWLSVKSIRTLKEGQTIKWLSRNATLCPGTSSRLQNFNYPKDWEDFFGRRPLKWKNKNNPNQK